MRISFVWLGRILSRILFSYIIEPGSLNLPLSFQLYRGPESEERGRKTNNQHQKSAGHNVSVCVCVAVCVLNTPTVRLQLVACSSRAETAAGACLVYDQVCNLWPQVDHEVLTLEICLMFTSYLSFHCVCTVIIDAEFKCSPADGKPEVNIAD